MLFLSLFALCILPAACARSEQAQLVDVHGRAIDDEFHRGSFWEAMAKAGFKRLGTGQSDKIRAEIWAIKQRGGALEVGWILFTKSLEMLDIFTLESDGSMKHAAGVIPQSSYGQRGKFTLSDRMVVYGPLIQRLKPPADLWILTQGFQGQADELEGPISIAMKLTFTHDDGTLTLNYKADKIPLDAVER